MKVQIVSVKFSADAAQAVYAFSDGTRVYYDEQAHAVLCKKDGAISFVKGDNEYINSILNYNGNCGDEQTMTGPDWGEWRRTRARAEGKVISR